MQSYGSFCVASARKSARGCRAKPPERAGLWRLCAASMPNCVYVALHMSPRKPKPAHIYGHTGSTAHGAAHITRPYVRALRRYANIRAPPASPAPACLCLPGPACACLPVPASRLHITRPQNQPSLASPKWTEPSRKNNPVCPRHCCNMQQFTCSRAVVSALRLAHRARGGAEAHESSPLRGAARQIHPFGVSLRARATCRTRLPNGEQPTFLTPSG